VYNLSFCGATNSEFLFLELPVYLERLLRCKTATTANKAIIDLLYFSFLLILNY
jgi:hypothetical protein